MTSSAENSKRVVISFYNALVQRDIAKIREFGRPDYIQHNPAVGTGLQAVIDWFASRPPPAVPPPPLQFVRVIAEGDFVVTIRRLQGIGPGFTPAPPDSESAIIDLWRVQDGLVAEHADYYETFPRGSQPPKHSNGPFF